MFSDVLNDIIEMRNAINTMTNKRALLRKLCEKEPAEIDAEVPFSIGVSINHTGIYLSNIPTDVFLTPEQLSMTIKLLLSILDENIERQELLLREKILSFVSGFVHQT